MFSCFDKTNFQMDSNDFDLEKLLWKGEICEFWWLPHSFGKFFWDDNVLLWFEGPRWNWNIEWTLTFTNILSLNFSCNSFCNAFMVPSMNIIRINLIGGFIFLSSSVLSSDITCSVKTVGDNCNHWLGKE